MRVEFGDELGGLKASQMKLFYFFFKRLTDQKSVLEKGSHQITVDNCVLNLTVRLLTDEATVQVRAQLHQYASS